MSDSITEIKAAAMAALRGLAQEILDAPLVQTVDMTTDPNTPYTEVATEDQDVLDIRGHFDESSKVFGALQADAPRGALMAVVNCGAGHLMRAKDYIRHRSWCTNSTVLPVSKQDAMELEEIEASHRAQIGAGLADAETGRVIPHAEVFAAIEKWRQGQRRAAPTE